MNSTYSPRRLPIVSVFAALFAVLGLVALSGCSSASSQAANTWINSANAFQTSLQSLDNSLTGADGSAQAVEAAFQANMPSIQSNVQTMQSNVSGLQGEAQSIATQTNALAEQIVATLNTIQADAASGNSAGIQAANEQLKSQAQQFGQLMDQWNSKVAAN